MRKIIINRIKEVGGDLTNGRWKDRTWYSIKLCDIDFEGLPDNQLAAVFEYIINIYYKQR